MAKKDPVKAIVDGIWDDLCDRSGYDLGCLDDETQADIRKAWTKIVAAKVEPLKEKAWMYDDLNK